MNKIEERGAWRVISRRGKLCLVGGLLTALLAACGGGGGSAGNSVFSPGPTASTPSGGGTTTTASAADLVVVLSKNSLSNTGSDSLTATVTAIDGNRSVVANVPVTFSINSNAVITPAGAATGADGTISAAVSEGSDSSARTITVTAKTADVTRTVSFDVVQAPSTTAPQAADLTLTLDTTSVNNSGSVTVNASATAVDSNRNALAGIPIQLSVDSNAVIVVGGAQSDATGKVAGAVTIGSDHSNRTITVTAKSGTLTRVAAFKVIGAVLKATADPVVLPSSTNVIRYLLVDVNQNPMVGQTVTVTATGVASATGTTDSNGQYLYPYTAPAGGASLTFNAIAGGASADPVAVAVSSASSTVPNATTTPTAATPQTSPNVVAVNGTGTANQSSLTVNFVDASNKTVQNVRVRFDVNDTGYTDTNQYGKISKQVVYSDASGNASSTFVPSSIASPTNGVTIRACWSITDFISATDCPHSVTSTLTVVSAPVAITIGTDNTIYTGSSTLTYVKKFVVLVVDAAGNPKADVQITPSIDLGGYAKGQWTLVGSLWTSPSSQRQTCPNEDLNRNAVKDGSEDVNGNGQLDPRKSDVSITLSGSTKSDANGVAVLQIEYPKSFASWVSFKITASATGVLSPPAYYPAGNPVSLPSTQYSSGMNADAYLASYALLPVDATILGNVSDPPFRFSPYGTVLSCTNPN